MSRANLALRHACLLVSPAANPPPDLLRGRAGLVVTGRAGTSLLNLAPGGRLATAHQVSVFKAVAAAKITCYRRRIFREYSG